MGSKSSATISEGAEDKQLCRELEDLQDKIVSIDKAITNLMQAIDVVCGTAEVVEGYLRNKPKTDDDKIKSGQMKDMDDRIDKAHFLLLATQDWLSSQQRDSLEILTKFFEFANNKIDEYFPCPQKWSIELKLNAYLEKGRHIKISENECLNKQHGINKHFNRVEQELTFLSQSNKNLKTRESTFIAVEQKQQLQIETKENLIKRQRQEIEENETLVSKLNNKLIEAEENTQELLTTLEKLQAQHRLEADDYKRKINELENNNSKSQNKKTIGIGMLDKKTTRVENAIKDDTILKLKQEVEDKRLEIEKLVAQDISNNLRLAELGEKTKLLRETISILENDKTGLEKTHKKAEESLNTTIKQKQEIIDEANMQLQKERNKADTFMREMNNKDKKYQQQTSELEKRIKQLEEDITIHYNARKRLHEMHEQAQSELRLLKEKKTLEVQLYSSNRGDMMCEVESELIKLVRAEIENEHLQLEFVKCAKHSDIRPDLPTILLCIIASRLGTDVSNAIQGLSPTRKMALMVFHHKDIHALPSQASERVLTGTDLGDLGGIFDMAFLAGKGIHKCSFNNNNFVSLVTFIKREGKEKAMC